MLERLENIKSSYEGELSAKSDHLVSTQNLALQQLKNMQQTMRQDAVNNQKEILRLREELRVKAAVKRKAGERESIATTRQGSRPSSALIEFQNELRNKTSRNRRASPMTTDRNSRVSLISRNKNESTASAKSLRKSASANRLDSRSDYSGDTATGENMFMNSPLISWLKQELQHAWLKEKKFK